MSAEAGPSTTRARPRNGHDNVEHPGIPRTQIPRHLVSSMLALDLSKAPSTPSTQAKLHLFKTSNLKKRAPSMKRLTASILSPVARSPSVTSSSSRKKAKFQWVKGELLGKGSYAKVYLGLNATTGEIMAVKQVELPTSELESQSSHSRKIIEALDLERKTLMELDHVNVVQYLGYEESPRYLSIFLEYVPGGTICTLLRAVGGPFPESVTKYFTAQVLDGLEYLHSLSILHRDLKSDNILVEPTGICKIADFGISKKMDFVDRSYRARTGMRGTIFWMAPEVVAPDKEKGYDLKIDIWSTGCVALEMWTGGRPWEGETFWSAAAKLLEHKMAPPLPANVVLSAEASDFRSKCFQRDPADRPSAEVLRKHPYLVLPPGWKYDASEFEINRRTSLSTESRRTRASKRTTKQHTESNRGTLVDAGTITNESYRSTTQTHDGTIISEPGVETIQPTDAGDDGPPLVFITPPGTPSIDDRSEIYPEEPRNRTVSESGRSQKSKFRGLKTYWLANPDPEPDAPSEPTFVYEPPPLPSINENFQYSNSLAPPAVVSAPYMPFEGMPPGPSAFRAPKAEVEHFNAQIKPRFSIWSRKGKAVSHKSRNTGGYGSESDDDDAFWMKRPESAASSKGSSRSKRTAQRMSVDVDPADRPNTATVYHNLEGFFPNCDLNMKVDEATADDQEAAAARKRRHKKSIRIVAEEHNRLHRGQRRRTKLWDSSMEEIHT